MKKILLQFPEGLKPLAEKYAKRYEREGYLVFLSARPTYGACDLALEEARALGVEKLVHFGHAPFPIGQPDDIEVDYIVEEEPFSSEDVEKAVEAISKLKPPISLITTVNHLGFLKEVKKSLKERGVDVRMKKGSLTVEEGMILGCDGLAAHPDGVKSVVYIGSGFFHPSAVVPREGVFYYSYSISDRKLKDITDDLLRLKRKREALVVRAFSSNKFGILVSVKNGQFFPDVALKIMNELKTFGKEAYLIAGSELSPVSISNYTFIEAFITTACPRVSDDYEAYGKPVLDLFLYYKLKSLWRENNKTERNPENIER